MSAVKDVGTLVISMGSRAWLMIIGVIFPGLLISGEVIWLYLSWSLPTQPILPIIVGVLADFKPLPALVFIALGLAVSCAVGYLNRDGSFAVSNFWLSMGWPPARPLPDLFQRLRFIYGEDAVNRVITKYGVFGLVDMSAETARKLPRLPESYLREFCKLWLEGKAPALSTQGAEIEINIVIGLVAPTALAAAVLFTSLHSVLGIALGAVALFGACFLLYRINSARVIETENAVVRFMFAHWEQIPNSPAMPTLASGADGEDE
jgi:hypothetical protein